MLGHHCPGTVVCLLNWWPDLLHALRLGSCELWNVRPGLAAFEWLLEQHMLMLSLVCLRPIFYASKLTKKIESLTSRLSIVANRLEARVSAVAWRTHVSRISCVRPRITLSTEAVAPTRRILTSRGVVRSSVIPVRSQRCALPNSVDLRGLLGSPRYFPPGAVPSPGGAAYLVAQCGYIGAIFYCCDGDGSRECCNDRKNDLRLADTQIAFFANTPTQDGASAQAAASKFSSSTTSSAVQISTSITSLDMPTAQTTSSISFPANADYAMIMSTPSISSSTSTDNTLASAFQSDRPSTSVVPQSPPTTSTTDPELTSPIHSNHHTVVIGATVGSSVAAVVILSGIFVCIWLQRHPAEQEDQEAGVERAAILGPSRRPEPASDWAESTLIDSHSHQPAPSQTIIRGQDLVEHNSPMIRPLKSFTHPPPSPLQTQDEGSQHHIPSAELESSFDVAPISRPLPSSLTTSATSTG